MKEIFISFIYASAESSIFTKSLLYDLLQELEKDCAKYNAKGSILIAGDLNARTSTNCDSVDDFSDKFSPINNIDHYINDGKGLPRQNMDPSSCDNRGEKMLNICKASHMRILNCRFNDKTGKLTRFPTKSGDSTSLIDYFIADESMLQYIKSFDVLPLSTMSDHCCLHASIKFNLSVSPSCKSQPDIVKLNQQPDIVKLNQMPNGFWSDKASMELFRKILLSFDY